MAKNNPVTFDLIKGMLPLIGILTSVVLSWGSLSMQNARNAEDIKEIKQGQKETDTKVSTIKENLVELNTIIRNAQKSGQITFYNDRSQIADITSANNILPMKIELNQKVSNTSATPTDTPIVTPVPTPAPTNTPSISPLPTIGILRPILQSLR